MAEDFDDFAAVDHFFHEAFAAAQGVLLFQEVLGGLAPYFTGNHHGPQGAAYDHQAHPHAVVHHDGKQGHHGNGGHQELGKGLGDHLAQGFYVIGVIAHHVPAFVGIKVPDGQAFHMGEQSFPDLAQAALGKDGQELIVGNVGQQGNHVQDGQDFHIVVNDGLDHRPGQVLFPGGLQGGHHLLHKDGGDGQDYRVQDNQAHNGGKQPGVEALEGQDEQFGLAPAEDFVYLGFTLGHRPALPSLPRIGPVFRRSFGGSGTGPFPGRWYWSGAVLRWCLRR